MLNEDAHLIDEALQGHSAAFGQLVRKYQDRLYRTAVRVVGCHDEARDVVQDAFVQAFVKLETFERQSSFYTWLYRIAVNMAISHRRRRKGHASVEQQRETTGREPIDHHMAPTGRIEQQERVDQVQAALSRLNDEHRTIIVLRDIEGLRYDAIAEILAVPVGTVRSRLFRARMQLRDQLKEVLESETP